MNNISFNIIPCLESNDHEVRILIDGSDFLGKDYLGIDPPVFFKQKTLINSGELYIGRCICGCEGCCDNYVTVRADEDIISWTNSGGLNIKFNKNDYKNIIYSAMHDYSWEDNKRTAERLVDEVFKEIITKDKYCFNWTSARIKENIITLSFSKRHEQKLFEFRWDGQSPENAQIAAKEFLKKIT